MSWKVSLIRQKATGSSASLLYSVPTLNSIVETGNLLHVQFVQGTKHRWTSGLHEVLCEQQFENMMVFFIVAYSNEPASYLLAWLMGWTWDNCEQIHAASNYSYIQDQHSNHLVTRPNKGLQIDCQLVEQRKSSVVQDIKFPLHCLYWSVIYLAICNPGMHAKYWLGYSNMIIKNYTIKNHAWQNNETGYWLYKIDLPLWLGM